MVLFCFCTLWGWPKATKRPLNSPSCSTSFSNPSFIAANYLADNFFTTTSPGTVPMSSSSGNNTPEPEVSSAALPEVLSQPDKADFSHKEKDFLHTHRDAYQAHCSKLDKIAKGSQKVKGDKKHWVVDVIYPEFACKFNGSGSNAESVKQVSSSRVHSGDDRLSYFLLEARKMVLVRGHNLRHSSPENSRTQTPNILRWCETP